MLAADPARRFVSSTAIGTPGIDLVGLFAALADVILVLDTTGRCLSVAPKDASLLVRPPAELIGKTPNEVLPREEAEFFLDHVCRAIDEGRMHRVEYRRQIRGNEVWFDARVSPLSDDVVLWIACDITTRKRAEEQLHHQLRFMEAITASMGEGLYAVDYQGRVTFMNPAAESALGYQQVELLGKESHATIHCRWVDGTEYPASKCPLQAVLAAGKTSKGDDDFLIRKDGRMLPVSYTSSPILSDGQVVGAVVVFRDVTERRALEEQILHAQKMEAVGQLAGGIAHDFNNLLTVINGYASLLLAQETVGGSVHNGLSAIRSAGERAALLTQHLLAFSRRQILQPRLIPINSVVAGVEPLLRRLISENIDVAVRLDPAAGIIKADAAQLEQIVINLAVNARDAMPGGGHLTLETASVELDESYAGSHPEVTPGPHALLVVADNGVGMSEATKARIFEPFFTTKEVGKGTGLGLAMVYGVVRQSGGHVLVESEPGAGTTFKIYFPAHGEPPRAPLAAIPPVPDLRGDETILIVEDNDDIRAFLTVILTAAGYTVLPTRSGTEAIARAMAFPDRIDLLITDVVMPGLNGPEVASRLSTERPEMKVLLMSGYANDDLVREALPVPGAMFLAKPFSPTALTHKVREVLDATGRKPVVLVVDDDPAIGTFLRRVLGESSHEVLDVSDGIQALQVCRKTEVDVVITDLAMPEKEGLETIQDLRREFPGIPIIAMSGMLDSDLFLKAAEVLGASAVLQKPIDTNKLLDTLRRIRQRQCQGDAVISPTQNERRRP
jgi:PAS domain S-box-containing protein